MVSHEEGHARPHRTSGKTLEDEGAGDRTEGNAQARAFIEVSMGKAGQGRELDAGLGYGSCP